MTAVEREASQHRPNLAVIRERIVVFGAAVSLRRSNPSLTEFTKCVSKVVQLLGDYRYIDVVRCPGISGATRDDLHVRVVMCGDQGSLDRHFCQGAATSCKGQLPVEGSPAMRHGDG